MDNVNVTKIQPINHGSTYVEYNVTLKPTNHTINGNFVATKDETDNAFNNAQGWDGFKELILKRIVDDTNNMEK